MAVPQKPSSDELLQPGELARAIDEIERAPEQIAAVVATLTDAQLRYKPNPKKWSALEILAHLADVELIYGFRLRQIIAQPGSTITPIDQDAWANALDYRSACVSEILEPYRCVRRANVALLHRLTTTDLGKAAFHPERDGDFTLADLIAFMRQHDPNHLRQIERLREQSATQSRAEQAP
ncbi:MAG TPA: DinB family protein [Terriglobales bacterium]|nr:DinB family protein [Terriglobales bacterium]